MRCRPRSRPSSDCAPTPATWCWCPNGTRAIVHYLQNVARLARILRQTGLEVRIGSLSEEVREPTRIELPGGEMLMVEPLERRGGKVGVAGFIPCAMLLNNDLSAGIPDILRDLDDQIVCRRCRRDGPSAASQTILPPMT